MLAKLQALAARLECMGRSRHDLGAIQHIFCGYSPSSWKSSNTILASGTWR